MSERQRGGGEVEEAVSGRSGPQRRTAGLASPREELERRSEQLRAWAWRWPGVQGIDGVTQFLRYF